MNLPRVLDCKLLTTFIFVNSEQRSSKIFIKYSRNKN